MDDDKAQKKKKVSFKRNKGLLNKEWLNKTGL